jgi:hypothetical protein
VALIYPISHASSDTLQNKIMVMNEKTNNAQCFWFPRVLDGDGILFWGKSENVFNFTKFMTPTIK